ncbi:MAG: WYL domain-containing protein [Planctomycetes bacterium]|nr:WYL domain-containing protein [Planctomycetota bacterium]
MASSAGGAKDPKVAKLERQLNLVSYLLSARAPVPFSDIRARVVGYDDEASPDAIEKRFDRDKADLRAIGVVIEYKADDPTGQAGYVIDKQGYFLPELTLEPEDAMLLAVLQRALGVVDDPLGRNLKSALAKLTIDSQLPEPLRASVAEQHLLDLGRPTKDVQRQHLAPLTEAVAHRRRVAFRYRAATTGQVEKRTVRPYGLGLADGHWYLVGWDEDRGAVRNFRLDRVQTKVTVPTRRGPPEFEVPQDFDVSAHVGVEEFQIDEGRPPVRVTLETDEVATWLLERRLRGAGTLTRRPDGTGTYEVEVRSEEGLLRWIAEFGGRVRILEPVALADAYHERLCAARALYA